MKQGLYRSSKGNTVVVAEDGRPIYAIYDEATDTFGTRSKFPPKYKDFKAFAEGQKLVRKGDFDGTFF